MSWIDRAGGLAGLGAAVHFLFLPGCVCDLWTVGPAGPELTPETPSAVIAAAFGADAGRARLTAALGLLAVFLLVVFFSRLDGVLRKGARPGSWFPSLTLVGGVLLAVILLVNAGFGFAASELTSYGEETQVVRFFLLWSWNVASLFAPAFALALLGTTLGAFTSVRLPGWYRWASAVLLVVLLLSSLVGPGLAVLPGTLWMFLTAALLVTRTEGAGKTHTPVTASTL